MNQQITEKRTFPSSNMASHRSRCIFLFLDRSCFSSCFRAFIRLSDWAVFASPVSSSSSSHLPTPTLPRSSCSAFFELARVAFGFQAFALRLGPSRTSNLPLIPPRSSTTRVLLPLAFCPLLCSGVDEVDATVRLVAAWSLSSLSLPLESELLLSLSLEPSVSEADDDDKLSSTLSDANIFEGPAVGLRGFVTTCLLLVLSSSLESELLVSLVSSVAEADEISFELFEGPFCFGCGESLSGPTRGASDWRPVFPEDDSTSADSEVSLSLSPDVLLGALEELSSSLRGFAVSGLEEE